MTEDEIAAKIRVAAGSRFLPEGGHRVPAEVLTREDVITDLAVWGLRAADMPERARLFKISDESVDSFRTWFRQKGANLKPYKANPTVLFAHDRYGFPIGRALSTYVEDSKTGPAMYSIVDFAAEDANEDAEKTLRLIDFGALNGASIGFQDAEWVADKEREGVFYANKWTLREWSVCPVPSNANALAGARAAKLDLSPIKRGVEHVLDNRATFDPTIVAAAEQTWRSAFKGASITVGFDVEGIEAFKAQVDRFCAAEERLAALMTRVASTPDPAPKTEPVTEQPSAKADLNPQEIARRVAELIATRKE